MPALDGLRGLAIVMVMLHHFLAVYTSHDTLVRRLISNAGKFGACGVDLFFVLSGFLITGILYDAKGSKHYFRNFYARRSLRIFPLYYGVLLVIFVVIPLVRPFTDPAAQAVASRQGWLWTYCPNFLISWLNDWPFEGGWLRLNHFWSLAVEEHFYLMWPAVVFVFARRGLLRIAGGCVAVGLLVKAALWSTGHYGTYAPNEQAIYTFTFSRIDVLAAGCFLAIFARGGAGCWLKLKRASVIGLPLFGVLLIACLRINPEMTGAVTGTLGFTIFAGFFASLLVLSLATDSRSIWGRFLHSRTMIFFGKYSYGLYVFNSVLGLFFEKMRDRFISRHVHSYMLSMVIYIIAAGSITVAAAYLSWHVYEKHFLKLKRFFTARNSRPVAAA